MLLIHVIAIVNLVAAFSYSHATTPTPTPTCTRTCTQEHRFVFHAVHMMFDGKVHTCMWRSNMTRPVKHHSHPGWSRCRFCFGLRSLYFTYFLGLICFPQEGRPWGKVPRRNLVCFIGHNLQQRRSEFEHALRACLA